MARQKKALRLSAFCFRFFFRAFLLSSFAGLDPAIHAEATLAQRLHQRSCKLTITMNHRHRRSKNAVLRTAMPGGDESESAVTVACHSSCAQTRRENDGLFCAFPGRGAAQKRAYARERAIAAAPQIRDRYAL
jgi:hypothetical protein